LLRQFRPALLGGAQLIAVGGNLVVEKALRAVHLGAAAARRLLGKDRQQRLDHVFGGLRVFAAIADGHQVGGDRGDVDVARQAFVQVFFFPRRRDPNIEIGQTDELFQIWPAQQRALEEIEMPRRVGVRRQAMQQRRQQRVGIQINAGRRFVFCRNERDPDPPRGADQPSDADGEPFLPPQDPDDRHRLRLERIHQKLHSIGTNSTTSPRRTGSDPASSGSALRPAALCIRMVRTGALE
jgi:hypothetical protein